MSLLNDEPLTLESVGSAPAVRAADQIYRRLRTSIMDGSLPPRTRLVELELAARLEVSRTPVREAISRLINDRLVETLPYGGVEVVDVTHELEDIYAIREALEGTAARLAAERITDEEVADLQALQDMHCELPLEDFARRTELNNIFHGAVLQASRAPRLIHMVEGFREFFLQEDELSHYQKRHALKAIKQHQEIIDALRDRDGKRAEKLVRLHLLHSLNRVMERRRHSRGSS